MDEHEKVPEAKQPFYKKKIFLISALAVIAVAVIGSVLYFRNSTENTTRTKNILKPASCKYYYHTYANHPFKEAIESLRVDFRQMYDLPYDVKKFAGRSLESVPLTWIDNTEALQAMYKKLKTEPIIAVDLEHHYLHSYTGLVSLMQLSSGTEDFLVDTIKLREVLQSPNYSLNFLFTNPAILKVFHGAESDIGWLQRDFDTFVVNMFDSFFAAKILCPKQSLAYLLERFLSITLDKTHQLADWRERPLSPEMTAYARKDTHYLIQLYFVLKRNLSLDQFEEVLKQSNQQCAVLNEPKVVTDWSWKRPSKQLNCPFNSRPLFKAIFYWREDRAKALDVSPEAIMTNECILTLANAKAKTDAEIRTSLGNIPDLLTAELPSLIKVLNAEVP
jgi:exosome complex exonuclease RRP6